MSTTSRRISEAARLRRTPVAVNLEETYREIGIRSFGRGIFHKDPVTGAELGAKRVFEIHPGDLVLSNVFAWEGAIGLAGEQEAGLIGSHRFMTYVPNPKVADASYLRHYFLSDRGAHLIQRASPGSAGRNRTLGIEAFEAIELPLPPIEEQRRTAKRLDEVVASCAEIRSRFEHCERVAAALPASLAQRPDLLDEEKAGLCWRRTQLSEVISISKQPCEVELGTRYPNVGILSYGRGLFEKAAIDGSTTKAVFLNRISTGQFIYSRLFAFEGAYGSVPAEFDGYYISNEFPTFDVDEATIDAGYLAAYFRSREVWSELARSSRGLGVRRQRVHPEALLAMGVWLPPVDIQRSIVEQTEHILESVKLRKRQVGLLDALESSARNSAIARSSGS